MKSDSVGREIGHPNPPFSEVYQLGLGKKSSRGTHQKIFSSSLVEFRDEF